MRAFGNKEVDHRGSSEIVRSSEESSAEAAEIGEFVMKCVDRLVLALGGIFLGEENRVRDETRMIGSDDGNERLITIVDVLNALKDMRILGKK